MNCTKPSFLLIHKLHNDDHGIFVCPPTNQTRISCILLVFALICWKAVQSAASGYDAFFLSEHNKSSYLPPVRFFIPAGPLLERVNGGRFIMASNWIYWFCTWSCVGHRFLILSDEITHARKMHLSGRNRVTYSAVSNPFTTSRMFQLQLDVKFERLHFPPGLAPGNGSSLQRQLHFISKCHYHQFVKNSYDNVVL